MPQRRGTQSSRDSTSRQLAVMAALPLRPSQTTTQSHFQPTDDFGRAVLPDRSRFRIKDKQVDYRENTLKTTGKILNCTFSLKYPSDAKAWIGKGPHYPKFDKAKA